MKKVVNQVKLFYSEDELNKFMRSIELDNFVGVTCCDTLRIVTCPLVFILTYRETITLTSEEKMIKLCKHLCDCLNSKRIFVSAEYNKDKNEINVTYRYIRCDPYPSDGLTTVEALVDLEFTQEIKRMARQYGFCTESSERIFELDSREMKILTIKERTDEKEVKKNE